MHATVDFPGKSGFIEALDDALALDDSAQITASIRTSLCRLIHDQSVTLPACIFEPVDDHYARRELYRSERYGYGVIAMTWGPGQGTPIHDHGGLWCVEGVWQGALEISQYELAEHDHQRFHFKPVGTIQAVAGSAGSLIPPHEYHAIQNPSNADTTVSVHIYSAPMTRCSTFAPVGDDWYARTERALTLDQIG